MTERVCVHCAQPLIRKSGETSTNYRNRRYCDKACQGAARTALFAADRPPCAICGRTVPLAASGYCSKRCYGEAQRIDRHIDAYAAGFVNRTERMQAMQARPLIGCEPQIKRLWEPFRHRWYVAEVIALR